MLTTQAQGSQREGETCLRRAQLSIALQAGMSSKVVKYLSRQVPGHGAPGAAPGIAEEAEVEAAAVAAL